MADCFDCLEEDRGTELAAAEAALNRAVSAYVEFLDEFRLVQASSATSPRVAEYNKRSNNNNNTDDIGSNDDYGDWQLECAENSRDAACRIKRMRKQLEEVGTIII